MQIAKKIGRPAGKSDTKERIISSAFIVAEKIGIENITADLVANNVGISRNSLRYHFSSMEDLLRAMFGHAVMMFDKDIENLKGDDDTPGAWLRAYIKACFSQQVETAIFCQTLIYIGSLGHIAGLKEIFADAVSRWSRRAAGDGVNPVFAHVARLAADGLWWSEVCGAPPLGDAEREEVFDSLMHLAGETL